MWRSFAKRALSGNATSNFLCNRNPRPLSFSPILTDQPRRSPDFRRWLATAAEAASPSPSDDDDRSSAAEEARARNRDRERLRRRQVKVETEAWEKASDEYTELIADMCHKKLAPNLPYTKGLFLGWYDPLRLAIEEEQALCLSGKSRKGHAPFFSELPAEMMAIITMHKIMAMLMTKEGLGAARVTQAALAVGEAIEQEIKIRKLTNKGGKSKKKKKKKKGDKCVDENKEKTDSVKEKMLKKKIEVLIKQQKRRQMQYIVNKEDDSKWGHGIKAMVGSRLIELLIQTAYIQPPAQQYHDTDSPPDIRPAFVHRLRRLGTNNSTKQCGVIECDPMVLQGIERTVSHVVIPYMPMLVPPVKWTGYDKGGHFYLPSYIMRTRGAKQQRAAVKNAPTDQMKPVFQALDTLGSTKWRVNRRVLHVIERVWATGECIADIVDRNDVPLPEKPDTEDELELKNWKMQVREARKENKERYAMRCDVELKLEVARNMKDEVGFYFPHNLDFRGRAYPMHPYLNHLGSDFCRGILEFAEGRPLGKSGLRWLKIHLATLYGGGVDKFSHEGRLAFTENHLDDIFDSADRPLEGKRWWLSAEEPCQLLAVCISLTDALRSSSPEMCISHVHVHQDGSCNGLQHYAALGRDKVGGAAVNLIGGDKPADVYTGVAERVLNIMKADAQKDPDEYPEALFAKALINQVDRKLVKQTVMTSVYGVTYIGARDQIKKRLKERGCFSDDQEMFSCACYGAKITITALGELFEAARGIMGWLGDCAKTIVSQNEPVQWRTPLGLPVVQPYRIYGSHSIKTSLQSLTVRRETEKVMTRRHKTAFPPNFVHSLDGSHMMMTAVACRKAGITFAGVHDSYWTHACHVDELNRILREKFVELYENPVLENLLESFEESFPSLVFPPVPERGELDLRDVLESPYFFN